ncbi:uncharacterized protein LOC110345287 [Heterocephalus glaber]|uniref:Uncharacterized protein LOC110345287 n=1 Tax=Heterocephalus glaber TaxID=10181 RepID=A0AAX6RM25_HETGA|nr:uncharacterized protein LOC110345287 [Heterocephalus glaber]
MLRMRSHWPRDPGLQQSRSPPYLNKHEKQVQFLHGPQLHPLRWKCFFGDSALAKFLPPDDQGCPGVSDVAGSSEKQQRLCHEGDSGISVYVKGRTSLTLRAVAFRSRVRASPTALSAPSSCAAAGRVGGLLSVRPLSSLGFRKGPRRSKRSRRGDRRPGRCTEALQSPPVSPSVMLPGVLAAGPSITATHLGLSFIVRRGWFPRPADGSSAVSQRRAEMEGSGPPAPPPGPCSGPRSLLTSPRFQDTCAGTPPSSQSSQGLPCVPPLSLASDPLSVSTGPSSLL